jgi:AraC-like DNA-binding protein
VSFYECNAEQHDYFYFNHVKKENETPPHFHGAIEFLFCVDGKQSVSVGGEVYTLKKGDACFIDEYVVHSLKPSGAELYAVVGDAHFFQPVFSTFGNVVPPCRFHFENTEFLSVLFAFYQHRTSNTAVLSERNNALVKLLLSELYESVPFVKRKENKQNELVASILQYAEENFTHDLSLPTLSAQFGYSRTYLSRMLHCYLDLNWSVYVGNIRARAAHRLSQTDSKLSVLDVALACGFDSLNTFYRAYRRIFGKTPLGK